MMLTGGDNKFCFTRGFGGKIAIATECGLKIVIGITNLSVTLMPDEAGKCS